MKRPGRAAGRGCLVLAALLCGPAVTGAQDIYDPRVVEFTPSELHASLTPDGRPYVTRYDLEFYYPDAPAPFQVVNLGKPKPDPDGTIRAIFIGVPFSWPPSGLTYVARVAAVGPGGVARSDASNTFVFGGRCNYVLSALMQTFTSAGGAGTISLDTAPECGWTASSSTTWAVIINRTGSGMAIITYDVKPSPTGVTREATITVAGQSLMVRQEDPLPQPPSSALPHAR
jgi:hypothetical protein